MIVGRDGVAGNCQLTISFEPQPCRPARARPHRNSSWASWTEAMLGLLHRLRQPHPLLRRLGPIPCPQTMRRKRLRVQPATAQRRFDQIDRLRRERLFLHRFPAVDRPEDRPLRDVGPLQPFVKRPTGGSTRSTLPSSSASAVLVRPSWIARHGNAGDFGSCGSTRAGGSSLNCSTRSRATSLRRVPPDANAKRRIARSRHRRADRSRR